MGGGLKGGGGGVWLGHPSSFRLPEVPAEGGLKILKLKSSWRQSQKLAVSLKHWKGRKRGGGDQGGGTLPPPGVYDRSNTSLGEMTHGLRAGASQVSCDQKELGWILLSWNRGGGWFLLTFGCDNSGRFCVVRGTPSPHPCVTFRLVVAPLRGPGRSPVLPFACCVGSLLSVGRCGRCSCWCRFRVRGAQ